jgi:hypothetical protein
MGWIPKKSSKTKNSDRGKPKRKRGAGTPIDPNRAKKRNKKPRHPWANLAKAQGASSDSLGGKDFTIDTTPFLAKIAGIEILPNRRKVDPESKLHTQGLGKARPADADHCPRREEQGLPQEHDEVGVGRWPTSHLGGEVAGLGNDLRRVVSW